MASNILKKFIKLLFLLLFVTKEKPIYPNRVIYIFFVEKIHKILIILIIIICNKGKNQFIRIVLYLSILILRFCPIGHAIPYLLIRIK